MAKSHQGRGPTVETMPLPPGGGARRRPEVAGIDDQRANPVDIRVAAATRDGAGPVGTGTADRYRPGRREAGVVGAITCDAEVHLVCADAAIARTKPFISRYERHAPSVAVVPGSATALSSRLSRKPSLSEYRRIAGALDDRLRELNGIWRRAVPPRWSARPSCLGVPVADGRVDRRATCGRKVGLRAAFRLSVTTVPVPRGRGSSEARRDSVGMGRRAASPRPPQICIWPRPGAAGPRSSVSQRLSAGASSAFPPRTRDGVDLSAVKGMQPGFAARPPESTSCRLSPALRTRLAPRVLPRPNDSPRSERATSVGIIAARLTQRGPAGRG